MKKSDSETPNIIRRNWQPERQLTSEEIQELEALGALPDDQIDASDIPVLPASEWRERGIRGMFYRPITRPVTMRLAADVIEWRKVKAGPHGKGYQTEANRVLRSKMIAELRAAAKTPSRVKTAR